MENGVPLTDGGLSSLIAATYFHDLVAIGVRFCADGREAELEPGYVMGWTVNNLTLIGGLENIMDGIGEIRNTDGEVVGGSDGVNQTDYRC